jgi:hypothetical protein
VGSADATTASANPEADRAASRPRASAVTRRAAGTGHFDVGITNSAPFGVLAGQRCMTDFCRV